MFLHLPSFIIMEFITTKRGARAIVYEGHKYVLNRRGRAGRIFWRCGRNRSCSGSLCTLEDEIISQKDTHNHPPDDAEIQAEKIVAQFEPRHEIQFDQYLLSTMRKSKQLLLDLTRKKLQQSFQLLLISSPPSTKIVGVNFHQCLSQGLMSTLMVSGPRLHRAKIF